MQQIKLSECKEGDKICLPSWQNGQKYRVVYWVGEPTSIVKYHTKVDDKGVKKRHKIIVGSKYAPMPEEVMNAFGVRGWDLVRVLVIGERMEYIFKRPKIQKHH